MPTTYSVRADWDPKSRVWVGTSPDIIGLVLENRTLPGILADAAAVVPELIALSGQPMPAGDGDD
jgi:hypothetical protein